MHNKIEFESQPLKQDWDQELPRYWFDNSPLKTHFMNALGVIVPSSEMRLLHVFQEVKPLIDDPEVLAQVNKLVAQEHWHTYSHVQYNRWLDKIGLPASEIHEMNLNNVEKNRGKIDKKRWIAIISIAEHNAAVFFEYLLARPELFEQMHPHFRQAWLWHALEEVEHKGVALDTYNNVREKLKEVQLERRLGLIPVGISFNYRVLKHTVRFLHEDKQLWKWRTLKDAASFFFGRDGVFTKTVVPWFHWLKADFHPWDHDTRSLIAGYSKLLTLQDLTDSEMKNFEGCAADYSEKARAGTLTDKEYISADITRI